MEQSPLKSQVARARGYSPEVVQQLARDEEAGTRAQILIEKIRDAFQNAARPRITLSVARALDDEWHVEESRRLELTALDPEQQWMDVSAEAMEGCQEYFTFSDAEGWRFYLPAFMCRYLHSFPHSGYDAVYWACSSGQHLDLLTDEQKSCVRSFLELCHTFQTDTRRGIDSEPTLQ